MKSILLTIGLVALVGGGAWYFIWDCSHPPANDGSIRGRAYWSEFNTVSNALAKLPGVTILESYYNRDITLEEFGFDILTADRRKIHVGFEEKDPTRRLSGAELDKALLKIIKQSSNHAMQRMRASRLAQLAFVRPRRLALTADGGRYAT